MEKMEQPLVPFKTPVDYFNEVLKGNYRNIHKFRRLLRKKEEWNGYDSDLHVYPYTKAVPGLLSVGCPNTCSFCPTAQTHKGKIYFGDPKQIIPQYEEECVHFMDENFFRHKQIGDVLALLRKHKVTWLAMSDYKSTLEILEALGEEYLYECGLRIVEVGLENVVLFKKVKKYIPTKKIAIYYLNMTCLPKETKHSIQQNAEWMVGNGLRHPIHFNNGVWYACGQFYHPYARQEDGLFLKAKKARVLPTWIPNSLLRQDYRIVDLEKANQYNQLVFGRKLYNPKMSGSIRKFIGKNQKRAAWLLTGIRCGAIE